MTARVTALTALIVLVAASMAVVNDAAADCRRPIHVGKDGIGYMLDGPIWWLMPDHIVVDAEAFEVIDGLWFIVEVEHGCGGEWVLIPSGSPGSGTPTQQQCQSLQGHYCFPPGGGGGTTPPTLSHCHAGFGPGIPMLLDQ